MANYRAELHKVVEQMSGALKTPANAAQAVD
jgi:hypothetical protein